ncbi:MAG TPA: phosphate ABC transporter permease subunit PstC [Phycisphaerales bacterium]|nr:phosphate ABC transporter permease subunit PstC [Phycisphaerales bacterium]
MQRTSTTPTPDAVHDEPVSPQSLRASSGSLGDTLLSLCARGSAILVILMLAALLIVVFVQAWPSIRSSGLSFLTSSEWRANSLERPVLGPDGKIVFKDGEMLTETVPPTFGALPVIYGTAVSSVLALVVAVPFSFGTALFLIRVAPKWKISTPVSFLVEFLAAIPSIAFGIWGLFVLAPFLAQHVEPAIKTVLGPVPGLGWLFFETVELGGETVTREIPLTGRDLFCGSLVLAIMVIPIITAVSRDVLRAVPRAQIEGTIALGATWWQSCWSMLHYSRSGLFGAVMLGLARAAGETMAVTMVIGNNMQIRASPFLPAQTMSSLMANEFAEASDAGHRAALLNVALILLLMSLFFNIIARWLVVGGKSRSSMAH